MIYFDFAESCWGFKVFVRIFVSARWNKSIWNCETNISAYLNADYFLQMIYFDFAERFWGLEVSVRIFVWNKSIWNCVTYIYPKCKSVCWLLSADDFEIATNGPNVANCNSVVKEAMDLYWCRRRGTWNIFRSSVIEKLKSSRGDSEVMDRIMNTENNLPFMNWMIKKWIKVLSYTPWFYVLYHIFRD